MDGKYKVNQKTQRGDPDLYWYSYHSPRKRANDVYGD